MTERDPFDLIGVEGNLIDETKNLRKRIRSRSRRDVSALNLSEFAQAGGDLGATSYGASVLDEEGLHTAANLVDVNWWLPMTIAGDDVTAIYESVIRTISGTKYLYVGGDFRRIGGVLANNIARYSFATRSWEEVEGGFDGVVRAIAFDSNDNLFVGGDFTGKLYHSISGLATVNGNVYSIAVKADGTAYISGQFTDAGGDAACDYIALFDHATSTFSDVGGGVSSLVRKVALDSTEMVYIVGDFLNAGGDPLADRVAKLSGGAWVNVGGSMSGYILYALAIDSTGTPYIGGSVALIRKLVDGVWVEIGEGLSAAIYDIVIDADDNIYASGAYILSATSDTVAFWNGIEWKALSNAGAVTGGLGYVYTICLDPVTGNVYAGGAFNSAGTIKCEGLVVYTKPLSDTIDLIAATFEQYHDLYQSVSNDTKDPTGWVSPEDVGVSYNTTTRQITLTGNLDYYWRGVKRTLSVSGSWTSDAHANVAGNYFLYSTDGVTFAWSTTAWTFDAVMVAKASYSTAPAHQFAIRETHGLMPWQVHKELHEQVSSYRESGGDLTAGTYTENTATDAATTPGFDAAVMWDEDDETAIAAWIQGTYTTLRIGASSKGTFDVAASFPFRSSGSYILVNNPATGAETAATNNQYVNVYQILIPATADTESQKYRMAMLQPQRAYTSLASAQAEDPRGLSLGDLTTTSPEFVFYARITYVLASGDTNTGKCRIATGGVTYLAGSRMSQISVSGFVSPTAENVPFTPVGTIAATNVQAAIEEVATDAAAAYAPIAKGVTNGDTHDHAGGDGAQIAYTSLGSAPSWTDATTFTPAIIGTTTAGVGTYSAQSGYYSKIGRMVFVSISLTWSAHTGTGNMEISGLPASANLIACILNVYHSNIALLAAGNKMLALVATGGTVVSLREVGSGAASLLPMDTAGEIRLSGTYFT